MKMECQVVITHEQEGQLITYSAAKMTVEGDAEVIEKLLDLVRREWGVE